jgi:hypothetical protein
MYKKIKYRAPGPWARDRIKMGGWGIFQAANKKKE